RGSRLPGTPACARFRRTAGTKPWAGSCHTTKTWLTPFCWRSIGNPAMIPALGCRPHGLADRPRPLRVVRDARRDGARGERCLLLAGGGEGARAAGRIGLRGERHPPGGPPAPSRRQPPPEGGGE